MWLQTRQHLLNWASRKNSPLVVNSALSRGDPAPRCKILAVPVVRDGSRVIGVLAFYNPPFAANYASRHVYLAKHLGLQAAAVIDLQFDLMTGLYTRSGLEKMHASLADDAAPSHSCILYLNVDHMHVVNELHGFEIGNELTVRVADLLSPPGCCWRSESSPRPTISRSAPLNLRPPCRSAAVWPILWRRRTAWIGPLGGTRVQDGQEPRAQSRGTLHHR